MRRTHLTAILVGVSLLVLSVAAAPARAASETITAAEARDHVGETRTVCGKVASTRYAQGSRGRPTFLNLDKPFPDQVFTIVIWGEHRARFNRPPEQLYATATLCVTGKIESYKSVPQIVVKDPTQIRVVPLASEG